MFEYVLVGPEWTLWKDGDKDACACLAEMVEYGHAREIRTVVELPKGLEASARETLLTNLVKAGVEGVCSSSAEDSKRLFVFFANGKDNVHPSKEGAKVFAQVFLDELKKRPGHRAATLFKPEALK